VVLLRGDAPHTGTRGRALGEPERDARGDVQGSKHHRREARELLAEALPLLQELRECIAAVAVVDVQRVLEITVAQVVDDRHRLVERGLGALGPSQGRLVDQRRDVVGQRRLGR
jgi:hypothetical protein